MPKRSTRWRLQAITLVIGLLCTPAFSAENLSPDIRSSQKFKTKRAGDTSSVISQEEMDSQALEDELDGKLKSQSEAPTNFDPATGAIWTGGASAPAGGDPEFTSGASSSSGGNGTPIAYGPDPAYRQQGNQDSTLKFITDIFNGFMGTQNPGPQFDFGTEAGYTGLGCIDCANGNSGFDLPRIDTSQIPGWVSLDNDSRISETEKCYSMMLLNAAKDHVRKKFGNRDPSGGQCALGVRGSLDAANMNNGVGLGHAIEFQSNKKLEQLGFRNVMNASMDADNAPVGSVLVFAGPRTDEYLANPGAFRGNEINGSTVGHVTIKGDDGYFYTDGKTPEAAVNNRRLVGVFTMSKCTLCPAEMKSQCAARNTPQPRTGPQ